MFDLSDEFHQSICNCSLATESKTSKEGLSSKYSFYFLLTTLPCHPLSKPFKKGEDLRKAREKTINVKDPLPFHNGLAYD